MLARVPVPETLDTIEENPSYNTPQVKPQVKLLLMALSSHNQALNRNQLQQELKLKDRKSFRERYIKPAMGSGMLEMTIPDKPNSRL